MQIPVGHVLGELQDALSQCRNLLSLDLSGNETVSREVEIALQEVWQGSHRKAVPPPAAQRAGGGAGGSRLLFLAHE